MRTISEEQLSWLSLYETCALSFEAIAADYDLAVESLREWVYARRIPQKKHMEKMVVVMRDVVNKPRLQFHPSFGYATKEQIDALTTMGLGPTRDVILKQIEIQNKKQGKVR